MQQWSTNPTLGVFHSSWTVLLTFLFHQAVFKLESVHKYYFVIMTGQTMAYLILLLIFCLLNNRKKSGLIGKIVFLMKIVLLNVFSL